MIQRGLQAIRGFLFSRPLGWLLLAAAIAALDVVTGPEIPFPITFVIPVSFAAWHGARRWALSAAVVLPLMRLGIALLESAPVSVSILVIDMFIQMAVLLMLAAVLLRARRMESAVIISRENLRIAAEIQRHLLPSSPPVIEGFDIAGICHPAEGVGGDYFDYIPMRDGRLGIVVADVSGHGVGPALLMAETRAYLRAIMTRDSDPAEILAALNRRLHEDTLGERFVTLFLGCFDPRGRTFQYAAAGHEAYPIDTPGTPRKLGSTGLALGILRDEVYDELPPIPLAAGSVVVVCTDGAMETHSPDGEMFGQNRVNETVAANRSRRSPEIIESLLESVRRHRASNAAEDDVTAVVIECERDS
jgi:phosphoserine phosphatase RsbU/P